MFLRDLIRSFRSAKGASFAAIGTLALGAAASAAVFTLANALLFKPLPYREPERLMAIRTGPGGVSWQDVRDVVESSSTIEAAAVYRGRTWGFTDAANPAPSVVLSGMVSEDFFRVLGVDASWDDDPGTVWLTHTFWRQRYGGDRGVVGRRVSLNDVPYRVVGVLPEDFRFPMRAGTPELYIPLDRAVYCCQRDGRGLDAIALRKPGVSLAAARGEMAAVSRRLEESFGSTNRGVEFAISDLGIFLAGERRQPLLLLAAAVAMLMLTGALNAGGILLAQTAGRLREAAIKASLGAGWSALVRDRLAHGTALGLAAGALGLLGSTLLLAGAMRVPAVADALEGFARVHTLEADGRVVAFCFAAALASAWIASLAPALLLRRVNLEALLRASHNASSAPVAVRARQALVVAQVAATVTLLGVSGMLMRSFSNLLHVDRGFRTERIYSAGIGIPEARYDSDEKMIGFHRHVIEKLKAIPGVSEAGGAAGLPVGPMSTHILLAGESTPLRERARADAAVASPDLLGVLGVPLLRGRGFSDRDRWGTPLVVLVNQSFVSQHLKGREAVGSRLRLGFYNGFAMKPWSEFEIVGVMADTRSRAVDKQPEPMVVLSSLQVAMEGFVYYVRTALPPGHAIRDAVWSIDRNLQAVHTVPLAGRRDQGMENRRLSLWLLSAFAVVTLLLAGVGLSAAAAASVAESRKEIGIRCALGSTAAQTAMRVVRRTAALTVLGFALGIGALAAASSLWRSQLYGVAPLDPLALCAVVVLLLLAVGTAAALPAWRAARVDPAETLRG